jgi:hypothetical protein
VDHGAAPKVVLAETVDEGASTAVGRMTDARPTGRAVALINAPLENIVETPLS